MDAKTTDQVHRRTAKIEWPTLALIGFVYVTWITLLWVAIPLWAAIIMLAVVITLHSSLQHEVIHGHPTRWKSLNAALVWPALGVFVPFARFRDSHLAHHNDARLTDPYDDPETNYLDPAVWTKLPRGVRYILRANNTLAGRMALGPAIGMAFWIAHDVRCCSRAAAWGWLAHVPAAAGVLWLVDLSPLPVWAYLIAAYFGLAQLKLRTFLEHQAHTRASGRSVIIEDRGPFAFLFLNNNLHVVHHMHPNVPWYALPRLYAQNRDHYLRRNAGYHYPSYFAVIRQYLWRAKDPVAHPLWQKDS